MFETRNWSACVDVRGRKEQEAGEKCLARCFVVCILCQVLLSRYHLCDGKFNMRAGDKQLVQNFSFKCWSDCVTYGGYFLSILIDRNVPERHVEDVCGYWRLALEMSALETVRGKKHGTCSILCTRLEKGESVTVAPSICGSSVWLLFPVTLLVPRILRLLVEFWKIRTPLG
jgi:hypothetical protein